MKGIRAGRRAEACGVTSELSRVLLLAIGSLVGVSSWGSPADLTVANGFGGPTTGASIRIVGVAAQPGIVGLSSGGRFHHAAGFLHVFQDVAEAQAREVSPDNDGDGAWDEEELQGKLFDPGTPTDPNNPDTDGDGQRDRAEAVAGTDPLDPDAFLHIEGVGQVGPFITVSGWVTNESLVVQGYTTMVQRVVGHRIEWLGRAGRTYKILAGPNLMQLAGFTALGEITPSGPGSGPWDVVPVVWTNDLPSADREFLFLQVVP